MSGEVTLFYSGSLLSSARVMAGGSLEADYGMYVESGGTAIDTTVENGGVLEVFSGGTAIGIIASSGAVLNLAVAPDTLIQGVSAGSAFEVKDAVISGYTVDHGVNLHVSDGGTADCAAVVSGGCLIVSNGGAAFDAVVNPDGVMKVSEGGAAFDAAVNGGYLVVSEGGAAFDAAVNSDGVMDVFDGGAATGAAVNGGHLVVSDGGTAFDAAVNSDGVMDVSDVGAATGTIVNDGGCLLISNGGNAADTVVNSDGILVVAHGGTAVNTVINYNGYMTVSDGGVADRVTINEWAFLHVLDGGTVNSVAVNWSGHLHISSGGTANGAVVNGAGLLTVSEGGTANMTTVYSGYLGNVGTVNSAVVNSGGYLIAFSGTVNSAVVNSEGHLIVHGGAAADGVIVNSGGILNISGGGAVTGTVLNSDGVLNISGGGTAYSTTVNEGVLHVFSGGKAHDAAVDSGGRLYVSSGGTALDIVENGGCVEVSDDADVTFKSNTFGGLTISDSATLHSGTTAENVTVNAGGRLHVFEGGRAASALVGSGGRLFVSDGGIADSTVVGSRGYLLVCGGAADLTRVDSRGYLFVSEGGTANSTTVDGGFLHVSDGGSADVTAVNSGGGMTVLSGGTANSTFVNSRSVLDVSGGGVVDEVTVAHGGGLRVYSGGTAAGIRENGGFVDVSDGADVAFVSNTFSDLVLDGSATVHSGTTACDITVDSGGALYVFSGGTANEIVENGGFVGVADGAEVTFLANTFSDLVLDGSATVHSGTTACDITVADGGSLSVFEGGTVSGSLQIGEGAVVSACSGAKVDFTVAAQDDPSTALINDWSLITGGNLADYTITVNAGQATGDYILAGGASGFDRTVTVKTADGTELGTVTVGETLVTETAEYTLARSEGTLSLTVAAVVVPALATVAGSFGGVGGAFQLFDDGSAVVRAASGRTDLAGTIDPDQWEIIGAGDFSGGATDGLLWLEKATGYVYMQNDMTTFDEVNNRTNCLGVAVEGYTLKAAGDFTGNGIEGALLQGPAFGDPEISLNYGLPVWARNDDGSAFNGWLGALVNTWQPGDPLDGDPADPADINARNYKYDVIGVGDFNGDGVDDVMLQNTMPTEVDGVVITGSGDVFTFLTGDKAAIIAGDPPTVCYAGCATGGWEVVGFGDFDGNGTDDALLSDGTGLAGWSMADGQRQGDLWFGNLAAGDEIAGIGDFDDDGTDDILIRSTATETLTAWLVQAGSVTGTLAIA